MNGTKAYCYIYPPGRWYHHALTSRSSTSRSSSIPTHARCEARGKRSKYVTRRIFISFRLNPSELQLQISEYLDKIRVYGSPDLQLYSVEYKADSAVADSPRRNRTYNGTTSSSWLGQHDNMRGKIIGTFPRLPTRLAQCTF